MRCGLERILANAGLRLPDAERGRHVDVQHFGVVRNARDGLARRRDRTADDRGDFLTDELRR